MQSPLPSVAVERGAQDGMAHIHYTNHYRYIVYARTSEHSPLHENRHSILHVKNIRCLEQQPDEVSHCFVDVGATAPIQLFRQSQAH